MELQGGYMGKRSWKAVNLNGNERENLLKTIEQAAHDYEAKYGGCAQCVLFALQENLGLQDTGVFKAASAFAGGMANFGETCGAISGGLMAVGLAYGREKFGDIKQIEGWEIGLGIPPVIESLIRGGRFIDRFREKFGTIRCREIRHVVRGRPVEEDFRHPTRATKEETKKDHHLCGKVTGPAARFAAEIILQPSESFQEEIRAYLLGR